LPGVIYFSILRPLMCKKIFISFFCGLACLVLAGHAVIPHHHWEDENNIEHHSANSHENDHDDNPLSEAFANFQHYNKTEIFFLITNQPGQLHHNDFNSLEFAEYSWSLAFTIYLETKKDLPEKPELYASTNYNCFPSLKAPPAFI